MSTKCTILCDRASKYSGKEEDRYHFYFDYKDDDVHLECDEEGKKLFLRRVAKLLKDNPFTDDGLYVFSLDKEETGKLCPKCGEIVALNKSE